VVCCINCWACLCDLLSFKQCPFKPCSPQEWSNQGLCLWKFMEFASQENLMIICSFISLGNTLKKIFEMMFFSSFEVWCLTAVFASSVPDKVEWMINLYLSGKDFHMSMCVFCEYKPSGNSDVTNFSHLYTIC